jgi:signal transduction histidine kinase
MHDISPGSPGLLSLAVLRRFLVMFAPAALLPGCVIWALYAQDVANERSLREQAGAHLVDLQTDIINRELRAVESDLLYLANQSVLRDFLSGARASKRSLQDEYLLFCRQKAIYDQIRYLDETGQEIIRVNFNTGRPAVVPDNELQPKAARYYFRRTQALERGQIFISPFDLNVEHDQIEQPFKPVIRLATPVFDNGGRKRGVLVLNCLGASLIQRLGEVSIGFPGNVFLLNKEGYFLRGQRPEDEWGFMFNNPSTFAGSYPEAWTAMRDGERGQVETEQGVFNFRKLEARAAVASTQATSPVESAAERFDRDAGDPAMYVVARIPTQTLQARARQSLAGLLLLYVVVVTLVAVFSWYLAYTGALRRHHEQQLAGSEARLRALSTQLMSAQENERRSLSRDLHDELGQLVTSVSLDLQRARQNADADKRGELIGRALHGTECLLDRIHEISARVRPTLLDDLGLKDAVQNFLSDFEQRTGIVTHADLHVANQLPALLSENLYRILQEALTNVAKHAKASEVFVDMQTTGNSVVMTIRDAGVGFDPATVDSARLGLLGMRERAELLNGAFDLRSTPGAGTMICVTLPIPGGDCHDPGE